MTWEQSDSFVTSDVIEWTEAIWPRRKTRRRSKPRPVGKQKIIAQVIEMDGDFIKLTILKSELLENTVARELLPHKVGTVITKKRATLLSGAPQRLHWSEEDVRKALLEER
ncbi:MAG: hypothetical protein KGL10_04890 [Alphaproteobacteria bacterium]|nr:hypothetical protein [Alphaproteobacteria bacterium]